MATQRAIELQTEVFEDLIRHRAAGGDRDGHRRLTSWASALEDFVFLEADMLISALDDLDVESERKPQIDAELRSRVRLMRNILAHSVEVRRELDGGIDGGRSASMFANRHEPVSFRSALTPGVGTRMGGVEFRQLAEFAAAAESLTWELLRAADRGE